ncbi:MAG: hypothetical protein HZR80_02250 [Candidatus Heimdallarchaeota archaeon]
MATQNPLILKPDLEYFYPEFNSKVKFTAVMEEVLYTLLTFFFLSGKSKLTNVINDLINVLDHTPKTIGSTLKSLEQLDLINYYQDGRYRTVELNLENEFLKSAIARFFGVADFTKTKCKKLKQMLIGFYPILDFEEAMTMFRNETQRLDDLIHEHQYLFNWIHKVEVLERLAKTTNSVEGFGDGNPILMFIDQLVSAINFQQTIQTSDLSGQQLTEIVTEIVEEFKEIPPWLDSAVIGGFNPWVVLEDDL